MNAPILVTIEGETQSLSKWCKHFGIPLSTVVNRVKSGMDPKNALSVRRKNTPRLVTINGECAPLRTWCRRMGKNWSTVIARCLRGVPPEKALTDPNPFKSHEWNGGKTSLRSIAQESGLRPGTLANRLKRGMTLTDAVSAPMQNGKRRKDKAVHQLYQMAKGFGCDPKLVIERVRRGWPLDKAMTVPKTERKQWQHFGKTVSVNGEQVSMKEAGARLGGTHSMVFNRVRLGWTQEDTVCIPPLDKRDCKHMININRRISALMAMGIVAR